MKIKIVIAFLTIAGALGLAGCKPKSVTLTGQVFIVTQGAENVKLGDVEILLIEKAQVTNFLQMKKLAIESEMASRQEELKKIEQGDVPDVLLTNAAYATASSECDEFQKKQEAQLGILQQLIKNYNAQADSDASAAYDMFKSKAQSAMNQMRAAQSVVMSNLENYPTPADYFENFSPAVFQKTLTDADGKFSVTYPRDSALTIFAKAERVLGTKTEKYFWLVNAPTNSETAQIFLSNQNLIYIDPDGYFKIRPKQVNSEQ